MARSIRAGDRFQSSGPSEHFAGDGGPGEDFRVCHEYVRYVAACCASVGGRSAPQPVILYIGDDAGDEPAFAALGTRGVSVIVGRRKQTRARFFVRHPGEVQRLLCLLAKLHDGTAPSSPHTDTS